MGFLVEFNASLKVENIALQRGERLLIQGLSFSLGPSEAIELRGANGTGKTTLLRAIAGLHTPRFGTIKLTGNDDYLNNDYISFLGHLDAIKVNESVENQLKFWGKFFGAKDYDLDGACKRLGIENLLPLMAGGLSAGQKRRVALVRAIISKRPLWLLDEPFAPLDTKGRETLGNILDEHRENGGMIIAAVHDKPLGKAMKQIDLSDFAPKRMDGMNV